MFLRSQRLLSLLSTLPTVITMLLLLLLSGAATAGEKPAAKATATAKKEALKEEDPFSLPLLPELPERPEQPSRSDEPRPQRPRYATTFTYRVSKQVVVTDRGMLTEPCDDMTVCAEWSLREINLVWSNGVGLRYAVSGHEPVSEVKPDGSTEQIAALRGYRVNASGSIEQVILTTRGLVLTSPEASTRQISVTYATAQPAITAAPASKTASASAAAVNPLFQTPP